MSMNLTLEERERIAYITNSPDHPLIVLALEGDEELREERDGYKCEAEENDGQVTKLNGDVLDLKEQIEDFEEKLGHADETIAELQRQIHDAGVDLV